LAFTPVKVSSELEIQLCTCNDLRRTCKSLLEINAAWLYAKGESKQCAEFTGGSFHLKCAVISIQGVSKKE
jgi:hypothetical protein